MSYQLFTKIPLHAQAWKNLLSDMTLLSLKNCIFYILINFLKNGVTLQSHVMHRIHHLKKRMLILCTLSADHSVQISGHAKGYHYVHKYFHNSISTTRGLG